MPFITDSDIFSLLDHYASRNAPSLV